MTEYYDQIDKDAMHKAKNHAKVRLQEIRDHGGQVLADFVAHYKLNGDIDNE